MSNNVDKDRRKVTPNPGSYEALALGCRCPVLDNAHGEGVPYGGERSWWINGECPLHGRA